VQNTGDILLPIAIGLIMFGIGLNLQLKDFKRVFIEPKAVISGLVCQLLLLPLVAFTITLLWDIDPIYKVGFILIAACPGGSVSNLVTYILSGRVALSVSLTSFNSFFILFTIPMIINLGSKIYLNQTQNVVLSFSNMMQEVFFTVIVPVLGGIVFNEWKPRMTTQLKKPLQYILPMILGLVFVYVIFFDESNGDINWLDHLDLLPPALLLNVSTIFAGYYLTKFVNLNHRSRYTIAVEMGLQNSALAIFIANQVLDNSDLSIVAIIYSSFSFLTTLGIVYLIKQYLGPRQAEA